MGRRSYTDDEKAAALQLLADPSLSFYEVRGQTGIPVGTLHDWAEKAGYVRSDEKTRAASARRRVRIQAKRESLAEELLDRVNELNARMDEPHVDYRGKESNQVTFDRATSTDVRNYAVAISILVEKFRLEMGEASEVNESRVDANKPRQQVEERLDELASKRQEREAS